MVRVYRQRSSACGVWKRIVLHRAKDLRVETG